jgi:hypothetical protein
MRLNYELKKIKREKSLEKQSHIGQSDKYHKVQINVCDR